MIKSQDILLQLLRLSLSKSDKVSFEADLVDWADIIGLSMAQGVGSLAFDAIEKLPQTIRPDIDSLMEWLGQTCYQESQYEHNWSVACDLSNLWAKNDIQVIILKGRAIAQYYPNPNHRYSCDLDVWISSEKYRTVEICKESRKRSDWKKACDVLEKNGVELGHEVYKEVEFSYDGVSVECHRYITPVRGNDNLLKFERYLRSLLECEPSVYFEGTSLINPPLTFTSMLYIEHALGDLLHGKFSLRQVVDWMVLRKQVISSSNIQVRAEVFKARCKEFGFDRFLNLVDALADVVEGKQILKELPASYQDVFEGLFKQQVNSNDKQSWFQRRVKLFFDIIRNRKMFQNFGYCSIERFLFNSMWTHFFNKEVVIY